MCKTVVETEETVYSSRYSNNGASPMWCFSNTCIVRNGSDVFVSGYERVPAWKPLNDCRWVLLRRRSDGWERVRTDGAHRTREPSPLVVLPPGRILLSANPTLLPPDAGGGGPARPEIVECNAARPAAAPRVLRPAWDGQPPFNEHSYRSIAADAGRGELILFQNAGYSHSEWTLLEADGAWRTGKLPWPPYARTDLAPFGATHARVNYPVVLLREHAVHFCGCAAYDNWDRVRTVSDLGLGFDPNASGTSGMAGRRLGNRFRRLLYAWTPQAGDAPFSDWLEIDNTFDDGGWLVCGDMHVDAGATVHMVWFRSPMLPSVRDALHPDRPRVYRIEYAALRDGTLRSRRTLVRADADAGAAVPTDMDQVGRPYRMQNGECILGDAIATVRFHATPDGRLFVMYYVSDGRAISENRILEIHADGTVSPPSAIPLKHPLTQFFNATPRAGCRPSWTLDLLGHRRGDWRPATDAGMEEYEGTIRYARIRIGADNERNPHSIQN